MSWADVSWIAGALVIAGMAAAVLRSHFYTPWFRLPRERSDQLPSRDGASRLEVTLGADSVRLPASLAGHSVLLRLTLHTRLSGHLFDPYIEMRARNVTLRQYFERGATGERYLNLSPMFQHGELQGPTIRIALRARGVRWKSNGTLESFPAPRLDGARVLVLAPHPDDAEVAAFGMYAEHDAWIATITAGEKAGAAVTPSRRLEESLAVPQLASVPPGRIVSLAYPDGALAGMHRDPSAAFRLACEKTRSRATLRALNVVPEFRVATADCNWGDLIADLCTLLAHARPDIVVAPHPLLDSHSDHRFTALALEAAMRRSDFFPELFLYAVHIEGAPMHPQGDVASVVGLPPIHAAEWVADQIHSHPLKPAMRLAKRRSLLAMSAIRRSAGLAREAGDRQPFARRLRNRLAGLGAYPANLLRRADRPNEIYYRVRGREFAVLVARLTTRDS